jgi:hypothetical protein
MKKMEWILAGTAVLALIIFFVPVAYQRIGSPSVPTDQASALSGRTIGERAAALILSAQKLDGTFYAAFECTSPGTRCIPVESTATESFGYAIMALLEAGYADDAEHAVSTALVACEITGAECEKTFFAYDAFYRATGEQRYKDAMTQAGTHILRQAEGASSEKYATLARRNVPDKLARLYELTGEEAYKIALERIAQGVLALDMKQQGNVMYVAQGTPVTSRGAELIGNVLVPAYLATKDENYGVAIRNYYDTAEIAQNARVILKQPNSYWESLLVSIESYVALASVEVDSAQRRKWLDDAAQMLHAVARVRHDALELPIMDGRGGFIVDTAAMRASDKNPNRYKVLNENGRIAYLFLTAFDTTEFHFPSAE